MNTNKLIWGSFVLCGALLSMIGTAIGYFLLGFSIVPFIKVMQEKEEEK
jgi:hypothetical protein